MEFRCGPPSPRCRCRVARPVRPRATGLGVDCRGRNHPRLARRGQTDGARRGRLPPAFHRRRCFETPHHRRHLLVGVGHGVALVQSRRPRADQEVDREETRLAAALPHPSRHPAEGEGEADFSSRGPDDGRTRLSPRRCTRRHGRRTARHHPRRVAAGRGERLARNLDDDHRQDRRQRPTALGSHHAPPDV